MLAAAGAGDEGVVGGAAARFARKGAGCASDSNASAQRPSTSDAIGMVSTAAASVVTTLLRAWASPAADTPRASLPRQPMAAQSNAAATLFVRIVTSLDPNC